MGKRRRDSRPLSYERKKRRVGLFFILPWMIGTFFFFILPTLESLLYSFGELNVSNGYDIKLIGFTHYINAFTGDSEFLPKLIEAVPPMFYQVPIIVIFSLFLAILINQKFFGRTVARAIFFLPIVAASGIIISIIRGDVFSQMMMQNTSASHLFQSEMLSILLNDMEVGTEAVGFSTGMVDRIFELIWKSGLQTLLFLAALQTVPASMYEAARIEGGTAWENFWKITFPMVSPTILINVVYSIVDSFNDYSNEIVKYINSFATRAYFEYSSAMAWVYTVISLLFVGIFYFIVNKFVYHEV